MCGDLSQIMLENRIGMPELVPGLGWVPDKESYAPQISADSRESPKIIEDQEYRLKWYMDKSCLIAAPGLMWSQAFDGFFVTVGSDKASPLHTDAISGVSYNTEISKFFLHSNSNVKPDIRLDEAVFKVDGGEWVASNLRCLFERRLGAMIVSRENK